MCTAAVSDGPGDKGTCVATESFYHPPAYVAFRPDGTFLGEIGFSIGLRSVSFAGDFAWAVMRGEDDQDILIKLRGKRYPSYAEKFVPPLNFARQHWQNWTTNMGTFLKRDFHMKSGMKFLIESFYKSIVEGAPLPIPYREILLTAKIMDDIFLQVNKESSPHAADPELHAVATR